MMATFLGRSPPRFSFREAIQGLDLQDFATRCILEEEEDGRLEFDLVWLKPLHAHGTRPNFIFSRFHYKMMKPHIQRTGSKQKHAFC
jgi:hypothetical protein